nr:MAG TPA: tail protein [Caudoviricetes sp.]
MIGKDGLRVELTGAHGSLVLTTFEEPVGDLEVWVTDLAGWVGGVGVESDDAQRKLGHGMVHAPARRTGRTLTLKGSAVSNTGVQVRELADRFVSSLLWDGHLGTLRVATDTLDLTGEVRLDGDVKVEFLGDSAFLFEVPLFAPEPWLYGVPRTYQLYPAGAGVGLRFPLFYPEQPTRGVLSFGSQAPMTTSIVNEGNVDAYPIYTVRGDWSSGFRITAENRVIEYPYAVLATAPVTIDCARGRLLIGGVDRTSELVSREWHKIPARAGFVPVVQALAPATGWVDVTARSTYI